VSVESGISQSLQAIRNLLAAQGSGLTAAIEEDSALVLKCRTPLQNVAAAFTDAASVVNLGGRVEMALQRYGGEAVQLTSASGSDWVANGDVGGVFPSLSDEEAPDVWKTSRLVEACIASAPGEVTGEAVVIENKTRWRQPIEQETGRLVWIGPSWLSFLRWLDERPWDDVLITLLGSSTALVLLEDWAREPIEMGSSLSFGGLDFRSLARDGPMPWPEETRKAYLRAMAIDLAIELPEGGTERIAGLVGSAAASTIGIIDRSGELKPHASALTTWTLPEHPQATAQGVSAIVALARWVARDPTLTRLDISRRVAAERIDNPLSASGWEAATEAAEIAYRQVVDERVQRSLATQVELERSFRAFDSELAGVEASISDAVDQVTVRVLAGSLGTAVAALTSEKVRGWPTFAAAFAIGAYAFFSAIWQLRWLRNDVDRRFTSFYAVVAGRGIELSETVRTALNNSHDHIHERVCKARVGLVALAVIIVGGGTAGALLGSPHQPASTRFLQFADERRVTYSTHPNHCHALPGSHPNLSRPDLRCTPGSVNSAVTQATVSRTICVTGWTATVRPPPSQTSQAKDDLYNAYGISSQTPSELDHLIPLELGGSNDITNLWIEVGPIPNPKDAVENRLRHYVCDGAMTLQAARAAIVANWMTAG